MYSPPKLYYSPTQSSQSPFLLNQQFEIEARTDIRHSSFCGSRGTPGLMPTKGWIPLFDRLATIPVSTNAADVLAHWERVNDKPFPHFSRGQITQIGRLGLNNTHLSPGSRDKKGLLDKPFCPLYSTMPKKCDLNTFFLIAQP